MVPPATLERNGNINVWWFPKEFSQSRFGEHHQSGTNSCTLISLILADKVSKEQRVFNRNVTELPRLAIDIFANAINDGNGVYKRVFTPGAAAKRSLNLNIPDAMNALKSQPTLAFHLDEWFYTHLEVNVNNENYMKNTASQLTQILTIGVELFRQSSPPSNRFLFAALIASSRTVLFVFDVVANVIAFFDSHQHGRRAGAVIAQTRFVSLYEMIQWFVNMLYEIYSTKPSLYEISFLTPNAQGLPHPSQIIDDDDTDDD